MLDADHKVTARSENVGEECILCIFHGVALADDGNRKLDKSSSSSPFGISKNRNIQRNHAVAADVEEGQGVMANGPPNSLREGSNRGHIE
jgi:hypothetical protein